MKIESAALVRALRRKFGNDPRRVLTRLGLDADLLNGGGTDPLKEMRIEIENMLGEMHLPEGTVGKILKVLDKHVQLGKLDDNDPNAERAREFAGDDNETPDLHKYLTNIGFSEDDAAEAVRIAQQSSPASKVLSDTMPVRSGLPRPATKGGFGGALAGDSATRGATRAPAYDLDDFARRHPELDHVRPEAPVRRRQALAADSAAGPSKSTFADRHPDAARITSV